MRAPTLDEVDPYLVSPVFYGDPYPIYRQLRDHAPVHWSESLGGWVLTRYDDVLATLRDTDRFSSRGRMLAVLEPLPGAVRAGLRLFEDHFTVGLINSDPPDHTRLRGLIKKAFTPRVIEAMRPRVQVIVDELLDAARGRGEMDLVRDLAYPLPAIVIAELVGAPPEARVRFKRWSDGILLTSRGSPTVTSRSASASIFCLGAPLARLEAPIAIDTVLRRLPRLELATNTVEWQEHGLLRALKRLPVTV